jgi:hypothetical protein
MAIISNSPLGVIHGSIGGITFYATGSKQMARKRIKPPSNTSANFMNSQLNLKNSSQSWASVPDVTKALWLSWAVGEFKPHGGTTSTHFKGNQAFNSATKLTIQQRLKLVPFIYNFDSLAPVLPSSIVAWDNPVNPPAYPADSNLTKVDGTLVPILLNKIEMRNDNFVKFKITYAHTAPPPLFENTWTGNHSQQYTFVVYASDAVPYLNAKMTNQYEFLIGNTGYIINLPNTLSNSQSCSFQLNCFDVISNNYVFSGRNAFQYLTLSLQGPSGLWYDFLPVCVQKKDSFSW